MTGRVKEASVLLEDRNAVIYGGGGAIGGAVHRKTHAASSRGAKELMSHTMLRYAIEHLDKKERKQYMDMK